MMSITFEKAIELITCADLHELERMADEIRLEKHPDNVVTYVVDRNINYTNVCVSGCRFCAFFVPPNDERGYVLSTEELHVKLSEAKAQGATQILLQGGLHPNLTLDFYERMIRGIKDKFDIHVHAFSPPEIQHMANFSGLTTLQVLERLRDSGLDSIPGGGAEILADEIRFKNSPHKCSTDQWLKVMRQAHSLGMKTTATMMFGFGDKEHHRIMHLMKLRELQDETHGFTAFIPWTFQPQNTSLSYLQSPTPLEYLKMLAISRIVLTNFDNIQASWVTQGEKIGQLALFFGANDMGGTMMEENVVRAAGCENRITEKRLRDIIQRAGFIAKKRNTSYKVIE